MEIVHTCHFVMDKLDKLTLHLWRCYNFEQCDHDKSHGLKFLFTPINLIGKGLAYF